MESRQGFELWRTIKRVVCLEINVRAFGILSRLQAEMRAGSISHDMWNVYMSRVVRPQDLRLTDESSPFMQHDVHFIVHRHRIRVTQSMENAKAQSRNLLTPLYVVQAKDESVHLEDRAKRGYSSAGGTGQPTAH